MSVWLLRQDHKNDFGAGKRFHERNGGGGPVPLHSKRSGRTGRAKCDEGHRRTVVG